MKTIKHTMLKKYLARKIVKSEDFFQKRLGLMAHSQRSIGWM